jgi:chorismate dehydratase
MLRISLVHYLNAAPLGWAFLHGPMKGRFEVVPSSPARCAEQLAGGEVDLGIIPSIEYQRIPGLKIVPGIAIASGERVRSVLLVRSRGRQEIRSIALDTNSRTSVALLMILLRERMGIFPEFIAHSPNLLEMLSSCDAALVIGDAALQIPLDQYEVTDLAEAWVNWQERPFVFAVWACRNSAELPSDLIGTLNAAKAWGCAAKSEIAGCYARQLGLSASFLEEYLSRNVEYDLTPRHIEGLQKFYQYAYHSGLIPELKPLQFLSEPHQPSPSSSMFQ